jgi:hypothetical protein
MKKKGRVKQARVDVVGYPRRHLIHKMIWYKLGNPDKPPAVP